MTERFWKKPYCRGPRLIKEIKPGSPPPSHRLPLPALLSIRRTWLNLWSFRERGVCSLVMLATAIDGATPEAHGEPPHIAAR